MSVLTDQEIAKQSARIDSLTSAGAEYQRQCFEQAERIKELEKKAELPMKYKRMQFNAELQKEVEQQAAEITRLREVLAKCKTAIISLYGCYPPPYKKDEKAAIAKEALAAIKEEGL